MAAASHSESFIEKSLHGNGSFDYADIGSLNGEERLNCVKRLIAECESDTNIVMRVLPQIVSLVPLVNQDQRYHCIHRIISLLNAHPQTGTRDMYNILDFAVVKSLQPLELISLAGELAGHMNGGGHASQRESNAWALIRLIPYLHPINQKEFAHDLYMLHRDEHLRTMVLDGLCSLIYSMDQYSRSDMTFFFADELKRNEIPADKFFVLELLKRVTPVLPESDRIQLADGIAPLLFYTDTLLVKRAIDFFANVISILPPGERFHYAQLTAGLINDFSVRHDVVIVLEKAIPFLSGEAEKMQLSELIHQFEDSEGSRRDASSWEFVFESATVASER